MSRSAQRCRTRRRGRRPRLPCAGGVVLPARAVAHEAVGVSVFGSFDRGRGRAGHVPGGVEFGGSVPRRRPGPSLDLGYWIPSTAHVAATTKIGGRPAGHAAAPGAAVRRGRSARRRRTRRDRRRTRRTVAGPAGRRADDGPRRFQLSRRGPVDRYSVRHGQDENDAGQARAPRRAELRAVRRFRRPCAPARSGSP